MGIGQLGQGVATVWLGTVGAEDTAKATIDQGQLDEAAAGYNARQAEIRGAMESGRLRMLGYEAAETAKVAYAAGNVDPTSGTAAAVQADTVSTSELDALTAKNNAAIQAWGFRIQKIQAGKNLQTNLGSIQRGQYASLATGLGQFESGANSLGGMGGGG